MKEKLSKLYPQEPQKLNLSGPGCVHAEQSGQLGEVNVVVELAYRQHVVFDDRLLRDSVAVTRSL